MHTIRPLVVATTNPHKFAEFRSLLEPSMNLRSLCDYPDVTPIEETGDTLAANCRLKATGYARQLQSWVLADDTGLMVDALDGAPGVRSARFAGPDATMRQNRELLLASLAGVPESDRTARFVCRLAIAGPDGTVIAEEEGECHGRILAAARGGGGFGYDALFELPSLGRTLAELTQEETGRLSHRSAAVRALRHALPAGFPSNLLAAD